MELSKEQYEKLKVYERQMIMAYKGRYLAGVGPKKIETFVDVYNELFNKHENYSTASCSKCLFNIVYKLGELYFKYQDEHANDEPEPEEVEEEPKEIEVETIDGEVGTMANSVTRTDANGNEYRLKAIEEPNVKEINNEQKMRKVKNTKKGKEKK